MRSLSANDHPRIDRPPRRRRDLLVLAVLIGLGATVAFGIYRPELAWWCVAAWSIAPLAARSVRCRVDGVLEWVAAPSLRGRRIVTGTVFVAATAYLILVAHLQHRVLQPIFHDEFMNLVQTRMLAGGHFAMPPHPLAAFFETFHVFEKPVYASQGFPGLALLYLPAIWLHLPYWLLPALTAGAAVALLYRVIAELVDALAGLVAALMLLSLQIFRHLSMMVMSQPVLLMLALAAVLAWLNWRRTRRVTWAVALGVAAGWAILTRPVEGICYAVPLGIAFLLDLGPLCRRRRIAHLFAAFLGGVGFLVLLLANNHAVTGHLLKSGYAMGFDRYMPANPVGFHEVPRAWTPGSSLPQRRDYWEQFDRPAFDGYRRDTFLRTWTEVRLPMLVDSTLPHPWILGLLPLGLLALGDRRRLVLCVGALLFLGFYAFFIYLLPQYCMTICPAVIMTVLLGANQPSKAWPRARPVIRPLIFGALVVSCILQLPGLGDRIPDESSFAAKVRRIDEVLSTQVTPPAIVLFHYQSGANVHVEPVYNVQTLNPDDAPIVRAQDLGERNRELFAYYARRAPQRRVYRYDRLTDRLSYLGTAAELATSK